MKIGLVIKDFDIKRGGGEKVSVSLAKEFVKKGHKVTVFARSFIGDVPEEIQKVEILNSK